MAIDVLAGMRVFTTVVDTGSFAAAADQLDMSRAMVSRHVALLESHLGARLLHRTTRRLSLTEAGEQYHERAMQVLAMVQEAADVAGRHSTTLTGTLRVTAPVVFGEGHLDRAIGHFLRLHPGLQVDLALSESRVDLVEEGFDLAVRVASTIEPGMIARRLARVRTVLCAAPAYLDEHGHPAHPAELERHNCMPYAHKTWRNEWHFRRGKVRQAVPITGNLRATSGGVLAAAALRADGIVLEPEFLVHEHLRSGSLVHVLPQWETDELSLFAVYPERRHLPLKVRSFLAYLLEAFGDPPYWEVRA